MMSNILGSTVAKGALRELRVDCSGASAATEALKRLRPMVRRRGRKEVMSVLEVIVRLCRFWTGGKQGY